MINLHWKTSQTCARYERGCNLIFAVLQNTIFREDFS